MGKETAIDWLVKELKYHEYLGVFCTPDCWGKEKEIMEGIVEKAKQMEKEQIIDAFNNEPECDGDGDKYYKQVFEDYYR